MSEDVLTLEAKIQILQEELSNRERKLLEQSDRIAELETDLHMYREEHKTVPPNPNEDTGELSKERQCANMLERIDNLESRESARAGAIQELASKVDAVEGKIDKVIARLEEYPVVDANDVKQILETLRKLPCLQGGCPEEQKSHLSLVDEL